MPREARNMRERRDPKFQVQKTSRLSRSAILRDYILLPQAYGPLSFWRATTVFPQPARAFLWLGLQQNLLGRQRTFE